ncbi:ABC-three component system middle component 6 [Bacillus sp. FJAT-44742]|uniref:ABC-three component system middle component 6 n=1 Tax=Bacillus sp. FJAT-44742 TaxID=2014005 RepID=UPI000C23BE7D|nr:ABC-three component system middle component 6 [Bacillus sp. FJAT-44742]
MNVTEFECSSNVLVGSCLLYKHKDNFIEFGGDLISLKEVALKEGNFRRISMNYFLLTKYHSVEENVLFTSKILYELLEHEKHIDQLFLDFANKRNIKININIERILYLSLTFLFSLGKVKFNDHMIKRIDTGEEWI